jgi:hypothetical protein
MTNEKRSLYKKISFTAKGAKLAAIGKPRK